MARGRYVSPNLNGIMASRPASVFGDENANGVANAPDHGIQGLAHDKVKALMDIAKSLRTLGIERKDLPIPKICVVGDQSTGKSSVIESISWV